jgi:soluble lytic murein transglycosylase-like protein
LTAMQHDYDDIIAVASQETGVPVPLLRAGIQHESDWNALQIGDGGLALGLMQVHEAACTEVGVDWKALQAAISAGDVKTAAQLSVTAGARYLARQLKAFGNEAWALAAYNHGPTVMARAKRYAETVLALKGVA